VRRIPRVLVRRRLVCVCVSYSDGRATRGACIDADTLADICAHVWNEKYRATAERMSDHQSAYAVTRAAQRASLKLKSEESKVTFVEARTLRFP